MWGWEEKKKRKAEPMRWVWKQAMYAVECVCIQPIHLQSRGGGGTDSIYNCSDCALVWLLIALPYNWLQLYLLQRYLSAYIASCWLSSKPKLNREKALLYFHTPLRITRSLMSFFPYKQVYCCFSTLFKATTLPVLYFAPFVPTLH